VDALALTISVVIIAIPAILLGLAMRHFVPLIRGLSAPLWAYPFAPVIFFSDRFFSEQARPHRKRFLSYIGAFAIVCALLMALMGRS
jgi:hypothetical protein